MLKSKDTEQSIITYQVFFLLKAQVVKNLRAFYRFNQSL